MIDSFDIYETGINEVIIECRELNLRFFIEWLVFRKGVNVFRAMNNKLWFELSNENYMDIFTCRYWFWFLLILKFADNTAVNL